jgi:thiosulfate dehydrogenase
VRFFVLGIVASFVAFILLAWLVIITGAMPINADATPPPLERWAARTALIAGVEHRLTRGKNPASDEAALLDGIRVYRANCEVCHGAASGAASTIAKGLYQKPPMFAKSDIDEIPYSYTSYVIRHGIRLTGMPAFSPSLSDEQIQNVALFLAQIKHLTPNERFAWNGAQLRAPLRRVYGLLQGFRACAYMPSPSVRPHRFVSSTAPSIDGAFIVEHFYNRGISEASIIGVDERHQRLIRVRLSKDGTADIAVAPLAGNEMIWSGIASAGAPSGATTLAMKADGSYDFRSTAAPGYGRCSAAWSDGAGFVSSI